MKNKLPIIFQSEITECALACLAMILGFHGVKASLLDLRHYFKMNVKGVSVYQLKRMTEKLGFYATVLRIDLHELAQVRLPCIMHWQMNHFVVIKHISADSVIIHDPACGVRHLDKTTLDNGFTGIIIEIEKKKQTLQNFTNRHPYSSFLKLIKKFTWPISKLFILSCLLQGCYLIAIKLMQICIDRAYTINFTQPLYALTILLLGIKLIELSAQAMRHIMVASVGARLNYEMATTIMRHLLNVPISFFHNRHLGDIIARFGSLEKIRNTVTEGIVEGTVDGAVSIIVLMVIWLNNYIIAAIITLSSFIYLLSRYHHQKKLQRLQEEALHAKSLELSCFMETIRAILPIKLFTREALRLQQFTQKFVRSLNSLTRISWHKLQNDAVKNLIYGLELSCTLLVSCLMVMHHQLSLGMLYALLTLRQQFVIATAGLVDKLQDYHLVRLHMARIQEVLYEPIEMHKPSDCECKYKMLNQLLSIERLCFRYHEDDNWIIHNLSFNISPGECVVITGPSGCGKSTLLKMMMGLIAPTSGEIRLGSISIYPDHALCLRQQIASVMQDDILMSGSIAQNICFFATTPDSTRIVEVAILAGIHEEIIKLPMGYETLIGDMGSVLSGGQKQRLILARALYAKPRILFLDEASSHLDMAKEKEVNHAIRSLGITLIMVAHRLETIQMADRVIELSAVDCFVANAPRNDV